MLYQKEHPPLARWLKFCLFLFLTLIVWHINIQSAKADLLDVCLTGCTYSRIQDAIDDANDGDSIEFPVNKQTFNETITINNKSLTFVGQTTTINAQDGGTAVIITGNPTVVMQNMIIQNGSINNNNGGGIRLSGGDLTLTNVTLSSNDATGTGLGGGLYVASSSSEVQLTDVTIQSGTAVSGGGIYNNGTLTADNLALVLNFATNGAGIYNNGTAVLDDQTSIRQNGSTDALTTQSGGGVYNAASATFTLLNLDITSNKAQNGAGIYNLGSLQVTNTNVGSGNIAALAGGGLYNSGQATLTNSALVQNQGPTGAGIYNTNTLIANNSTLSRNAGLENQPSVNGPGLYNNSGSATLNNVTIHLTIGTSLFRNGGTVTVGNSIISSASGQTACGGSGGTAVSNGYNLANDQTCTFLTKPGDIQGVNPDLNAVTSPADSAAFHSPKLTSPVVDAGNPATPGSGGTACLASDQRGFVRPLSARCDIGAVEIVVNRLYVPSVTK